ncbi:MAG: tetratricopeptide repeat protein [Thermodesulfovibrio sp.]|uniref:tetratricopeptide repeat protein n=1 Tax=unclassified Thermodesulfovibrio TaxID=2645936 RepID=UPI000839E7A0|nr:MULTISPECIES: tetratricopeptide repeat protein [unclassified Thermodesulfovibrio]MDI1471358.1 tetratricopeptide repeat protein [Thermodesulfovibrio sp. 1176]MDI6714615.1 tetratricopeptide repeat protein [Thermodesulfovibrio sp.]ODA44312.1 TPR repeat [Thermodesulfovibrio sp. N1]
MEKQGFEERFEEANLLLRYKAFEEACKIYSELINENSNLAELHNNYGLALFYLNKFEEAINEFKKSIEINSAFSLPYANIGLVYLNKEEYDKAVEFFLKALELDPENPETHYNLAVTYYRMDRKPDSLRHYEAFTKYSGEDYQKLKESVQKIILQIKETLQTEEGVQE